MLSFRQFMKEAPHDYGYQDWGIIVVDTGEIISGKDEPKQNFYEYGDILHTALESLRGLDRFDCIEWMIIQGEMHLRTATHFSDLTDQSKFLTQKQYNAMNKIRVLSMMDRYSIDMLVSDSKRLLEADKVKEAAMEANTTSQFLTKLRKYVDI